MPDYDPFSDLPSGGNVTVAPAPEPTQPEPKPSDKPKEYNPAVDMNIGVNITQGVPLVNENEARARIRKSMLPKTWFGEFTHGISRGVDSLQETMYGAGALAADWVGWDGAKNWLVGKTKQQEREQEFAPSDYESYQEVNSFDSAMRYFLGQLGQGVPQVAESVGTGMIGAVAGTAVEPGAGTVVGGLSGIVERQAVKSLIKKEVGNLAKEELEKYAAKQITKDALSEGTQALLKQEALGIAKYYGATSAIAINSWAQESGSIYSDMLSNPNISEQDRKIASTVGGLVASLPDTFVGSWIAGKFFPGAKEVTKEQVGQVQSYLKQYIQTYGKEILKVLPAEGGQEFIQTVAEQASKDWAEFGPKEAMRRVFQPTPDELKERIDSTFGGATMGLLGGGVAAAGETNNLRAHQSATIRAKENNILSKANEQSSVPKVEVSPEDQRLSAIEDERTNLEALHEHPATSPAEKASIMSRIDLLNKEEEGIKQKLGVLVNENPAETVRNLYGRVKNEYLNTPEAALDPDGKAGFSEGVRTLSPEDQSKFTAHGISKGDVYTSLGNILEGGLAQGSHEGPLTPTSNPGENTAVTAPFILLSKPGQTIGQGGVGAVVVNHPGAQTVAEELKKQYPQHTILTQEEMPGWLKEQSSLVNETSPTEPKVGTELASAVTKLRALMGGKTQTGKQTKFATAAQLNTKQAEVTTLLDKIAPADNTKAQKYRSDVEKALAGNLNLFAAEDIKLVTNSESEHPLSRNSTNFQVTINPSGTIELVIPHFDGLADDAHVSNNIQQTMTHEVIHVGDVVAQRDEYNNSQELQDKYADVSTYANAVDQERAEALKNWWSKLSAKQRAAFPGIARQLREVYEPGHEGQATYNQLGSEVVRMMAELARTGQLTETTEALIQAQREAKDDPERGRISRFLKVWIDGLRRIHETLKKLFNRETAPAEITKAFNQIQEVLDKYGAAGAETTQQTQKETLVNEKPDEPVTVGEAINVNAKVEIEGQRGRLSEEGGEIIFRANGQDYIVSGNLDTPLSEIGAELTKPEAVKEKVLQLREPAQQEAQPEPLPAQLATKPSEAQQIEQKQAQQREEKRKAQQTPYQRYREALKEAKSDSTKMAEAQRAHWEYRKKSMTRDEAAREFKEVYGDKATLASYKRNTLVNESKAPAEAKSHPHGEMLAQEAEGVKFDGVIMDRFLQFTDTTVGTLGGASFVVPVDATVQQFKDKLAFKRAQFGAQPKQSPFGLNPRKEAKLNKLAEQANEQTNEAFGPETNTGKSHIRERQGQMDFDTRSPQNLEYNSQPHTEAATVAQQVMNDHGLWHVVETLEGDVLGRSLTLDEGNTDRQIGPNGTLKALYELALTHLAHIAHQMEGNYLFSAKDRALVNEKFSKLEENVRGLGTDTGQFNSFTGKLVQFWNGAKAKATYVKSIISHAMKVLGKKATERMQELATELNKVIGSYVKGVLSRPEMIAYLRKMQEKVHTRKWQTELRKTIAKDEKRAKTAARKAAARAAEHIALEEDGDAYVNKVVDSIIASMVGPVHESNSPTELEIFRGAINKMARSVLQEMGLTPESQKSKRVSMQDEFAAILKNDTLYAQFVNQLHDDYVKELGGDNPSRDFLDQADMLRARLANRYTPGMVDKLLAEKMREYELKFGKMVQEKIGEGGGFGFEEKVRNDLRDDIAAAMRYEGVDNADLIDKLVQDIQESFDEQIGEARERFFGSSGAVRDALKFNQDKLAEIAKEHASYGDSYQDNFEKFLVNEYGFPNTDEMPIAREIAALMQSQLNKMLNGFTDEKGRYHPGERERIISNWMKTAATSPDSRKGLTQSVDRIIQLANMGVMRTEDVYRALSEKFGLPPYKPEVAAEIEKMGEQIANTSDDRTKDILKQQLTNYLTSQSGLSTRDIYISGLYTSMLSGPSTQMVNIMANVMSLLGYMTVEAVKHPFQIGRMVRALVRSAFGSAQVEMRESLWTGLALGKEGTKFFRGANPLELKNPVIESRFKNPTLKKLDEGFAKFLHWMLRGVKAHYVGRALTAADIFFYKMAQEVAFAAREGKLSSGTPEMWSSAMAQARREVEAQGLEPDTNRADKRRMMVLAHQYFNDERRLVNESTRTSWQEAHSEAIDATFQQEPKGWLGLLATLADKWTANKPIGKLIIPFTRVAANVTNHMLEWTPYGLARFAFSKDFKLEHVENGETVLRRDKDIAIRAILGTAMVIALLLRIGEEPDDDPDFTIYADGPNDVNAKRQMMERGWKPYSIKMGGKYYSYLYTPVGMSFAIIGRMLDDYRDGKIDKPSLSNVSMASTATAMLRLVTQQSFLAGVSDIMSAVDSPDPNAKLSRFFARATSTLLVPNFFKQVDRYFNPTVQQADGFWQSFIRELPIARNSLKPMLNVFGEPVQRTEGAINFPGVDRFVTNEKDDDPVWNLLGSKRVVMPGFSKATKLNGKPMSEEEFYAYVQKAGPRIKKAIGAEVNRLSTMSREAVKDRIEDIATEIKREVRDEMIK